MIYYMDINDFLRCVSEIDRKSITPLLIIQYGGIIIPAKKLRTHYFIDVKEIFNK